MRDVRGRLNFISSCDRALSIFRDKGKHSSSLAIHNFTNKKLQKMLKRRDVNSLANFAKSEGEAKFPLSLRFRSVIFDMRRFRFNIFVALFRFFAFVQSEIKSEIFLSIAFFWE